MRFKIGHVFKPLSSCASCPHGADLRDGALFCGKDGSQINVLDAAAVCPDGRWKSEAGAEPKTFLRTALRSMKDNWERAAEFARTATSGFVDEPTLFQRRQSCETCPALKRQGDKKFCGACGCPQWTLSELDTKLRFRELECPLGRPGFHTP